MLGISDAAESIGFRTRGYRLTWEQLRDEVPLPCIVHWRQRHFVVVYAIKKPRKLSQRLDRINQIVRDLLSGKNLATSVYNQLTEA